MAHSTFTLDLCIGDVTDKDLEFSSSSVKELFLNWSIFANVKNNSAGIKYLTVYLECDSRRNTQTWGCRTKDKFILKNQNSQPLRDYVKSGSFNFEKGEKSFGYEYFYKFDDLVNKANGFILNDGIWIQIEVSPETPSGIHYDEKSGIKVKFRFDSAAAATSTVNMLYLLRSGEGSNVTLVSRDKVKFKVHRGILKMKSEAFGPMVAAEMKEGRTGVVNIADMDGSSMEMFLRFLYVGDLSKMEESSLKEVKQLINAAEKYGLPELKKYCGYLLVERCKPKNAPKLYWFAKKFGLQEAAQEIFKFVEANFKDFWEELVKSNAKEESTFDTDSE